MELAKVELDKYQTYTQIQERGYSKTSIVRNESGESFFAKWIKGIQKNSQPSKILFDKLRHLKKAVHPALPKIIEYDWDNEQEAYCIIFEYKNAQTLEERIWNLKPIFFLKGIEQIVNCLQQLNQNHRLSHGDITPANILVDENFDFYLIDFGLSDISSTLSQAQNLEVFAREFAAPEKWNRKIPKGFPYQSDIFSIGKVIEWYFERNESFSHPDIMDLLDRTCSITSSERGNFASLIDTLKRLKDNDTLFDNNLVQIEFDNYYSYQNDIISELNENYLKVFFDVFPAKGENILMNLLTPNYFLHCLWVIEDNKLVVLKNGRKEEFEEEYSKSKRHSKNLGIKLNFTNNSSFYYSNQLDLTPFLKKIQKEKQSEGEYRKGKIEINKELLFFKKLLEKELKVLEENSLRLRYDSFEKKGDFEIWFKIQNNEKYSKNGHIYTHIDKSTPPNPEEFEYILSQTADKKQMKDPLKFSGVAYDFNTKTRVLKYKDCEHLDFEKIPKNGYIFENISKQEEEKKRQQEAIRKVEYNEVQNRDLIHYLFNPTDLQGEFINQYELQKVFQTDKAGNELIYSDNQTKAILNAIQREPLTVIQGPPGTGKTTVITEIVFQILDKNPDAKILITSQTNDAVDNVLDNLLEKEIPIVRLSGVRKPKQSLRKHTLERKIEGWKLEVKKRAKKEWEKSESGFLQEIEKNNILLKSIITLLIDKKEWKIKKAQIEKLLERIKGYDNLKDFLQNQDMFINAFDKQTNCGFLSFFNKLKIHNDWLASISSLDENSTINQKLIDSIRVIGATTNHIASKKYSKYNFEFDYVIMDESGKATTAEALIPIVLAEKLVLVGDHRQLRPMLTANREVEKWLREEYKTESDEYDSWDDYFNRPSLFEQVITRIDDDFKSQLEECRRMPKESVLLTSKCFYEPFGDEAIIPIKRPQDKEHNLDLKVDSSIIFLDIGNSYKSKIDGSGSSSNELSANLIPKLLLELDNFEKVKDFSIGVITGYTAQLKEIRKVVRRDLYNKQLKRIDISKVDISVVDKFQGLEKDIIIFDLVRSRQNSLGFLNNANRINVALSRHKKLLIIIGNYDWLVSVKSNINNPNSTVPLQKYLRELKEWRVKNIQQIF